MHKGSNQIKQWAMARDNMESDLLVAVVRTWYTPCSEDKEQMKIVMQFILHSMVWLIVGTLFIFYMYCACIYIYAPT